MFSAFDIFLMDVIEIRYSGLRYVMKKTHLQDLQHIHRPIHLSQRVPDKYMPIDMFRHGLLARAEKMKTATWSLGEHSYLEKEVGNGLIRTAYFFFFHKLFISSMTLLASSPLTPIASKRVGFSFMVLHRTIP